jgi:preprotein translocase subunit Sec61beta
MSEDCGSSNSITPVVFVLIGISVAVIVVIIMGASVTMVMLGDGSRFVLKV